MSIKQRIWRLSLLAILGSVVGTAATFVMASAASRTIDSAGAAGSSLDALYVMQSSLSGIEETFKYAVSASDKSALDKTVEMAKDFRAKTAELAALSDPQPLAGQVGRLFDAYYGSAYQATGIMLGTATGDTTTVIQAMQEAQQGLHKALADGRGELTRQFDASLARAGSRVHLQVLISLLVGACVAVAIVVTSRRLMPAIVNPIEQTVRVLADIESGKLDTEVTATSDDEMGQVLKSLDTMRRSLKERIEREGQSALENARIRSALDCVAVAAMLVDTSGKVIYVNDYLKGLFTQRAADLAVRWPALRGGSLVGSTLDAFAGVPALEHRRLLALSSPEATDLEVGSAQLRIVANPVRDSSGSRVGTVVQWTDRSQEVNAEREVQATVARALEGDLTVRLDETGRDGFFRTLASGVNHLLENMSELLRTMTTAAAALRAGAEDIASGNQNLAKRTEEQSASLEEAASSMEQMTSTVKNTADNAGQANQLASAARQQAESGGSVVGAAINAMSEINDSSRKIGQIIGVINDIAFQTNLLALNAAVEAARAGEQGRGFAVVATEVRSLAGRSATAAKEIKSLIEDSVLKVEEGSRLVDESGKVLAQIVTSVKKVTDIVSEIAAGTQEQSAGISQVNREVMQMDQATQQNATLVDEAAAAGRAIAEQVDALNGLVARYTVNGTTGRAGQAARSNDEGTQGVERTVRRRSVA